MKAKNIELIQLQVFRYFICENEAAIDLILTIVDNTSPNFKVIDWPINTFNRSWFPKKTGNGIAFEPIEYIYVIGGFVGL